MCTDFPFTLKAMLFFFSLLPVLEINIIACKESVVGPDKLNMIVEKICHFGRSRCLIILVKIFKIKNIDKVGKLK